MYAMTPTTTSITNATAPTAPAIAYFVLLVPWAFNSEVEWALPPVGIAVMPLLLLSLDWSEMKLSVGAGSDEDVSLLVLFAIDTEGKGVADAETDGSRASPDVCNEPESSSDAADNEGRRLSESWDCAGEAGKLGTGCTDGDRRGEETWLGRAELVAEAAGVYSMRSKKYIGPSAFMR